MINDYTQYTCEQLREFISQAGFDSNIKGKQNLAIFMEENNIVIDELGTYQESFQQALENSEIEEEIHTADEVDTEDSEPKYTDPEWNDYVISKLGPGEIDDNGHPLLVGLRRVTEELLGEVLLSGPIQSSYSIQNGPHSNCIYELQILWKKDAGPFVMDESGSYNLPIKTFRAAADSYGGNTDQPFDQYASAIAEARAEARTYRKALNLKVVTKEELCNKLILDSSNRISQNQLNLISVKIKSLGLKEDFSKDVVGKSLSECSKEDGQVLIRKINEYQQNIKDIPKEVKNN